MANVGVGSPSAKDVIVWLKKFADEMKLGKETKEALLKHALVPGIVSINFSQNFFEGILGRTYSDLLYRKIHGKI